LRVKFLVTPVGLMWGNVVSARRLGDALLAEGVEVIEGREEKEYDLLHVHTPVPPGNALEVRRAKKKGIPVVIHAHTTAEDARGTWTGSTLLSGWVGRYLNRFYNMADLVLSPSEWTKERLKARGLKAPVRVISNGVDLKAFSFDPQMRQRFRGRLGLSGDRTLVYMVGVVCLKKGIEVIPKIAGELPEMDFVWVGRRSRLYSPLRVRRAISKCPSNVRFMDDLEDVREAHNGGDVFFTPSFAENQGVAVMEAMAAERPVVARNLEVYRGLLEDRKSALLGNTEGDFVEAIRKVGRGGDLAKELACQGRLSVESHDIGRVSKELVTIYEGLLKRKSF